MSGWWDWFHLLIAAFHLVTRYFIVTGLMKLLPTLLHLIKFKRIYIIVEHIVLFKFYFVSLLCGNWVNGCYSCQMPAFKLIGVSKAAKCSSKNSLFSVKNRSLSPFFLFVLETDRRWVFFTGHTAVCFFCSFHDESTVVLICFLGSQFSVLWRRGLRGSFDGLFRFRELCFDYLRLSLGWQMVISNLELINIPVSTKA